MSENPWGPKNKKRDPDYKPPKVGPRNLHGRFENQGRPQTKLTDSLQRRLIKAAGGPLHESQIALKCGVAPATLMHWLKRGLSREVDEPYTSFAMRFIRAVIKTEEKAANRIRNGDDEWRATLAWLERRFPKRWNAALMELQNVREAFELADGQSRDELARTTLARPSPELLRAIQAAGFDLVRRNGNEEEAPTAPNTTTDAGLSGSLGRDGAVGPSAVVETTGTDAGAPTGDAQPSVGTEAPALVQFLRRVGERDPGTPPTT